MAITRGVTTGGKEAQFSGYRITSRQLLRVAPNDCGGVKKSQQCHQYFLQYSTFASERPQVRSSGRQTCFLPGCHLTSLRPLTPEFINEFPLISIWRLVMPHADNCVDVDILKARWLRPALAESYRLLRVDQVKELVAVRVCVWNASGWSKLNVVLQAGE